VWKTRIKRLELRAQLPAGKQLFGQTPLLMDIPQECSVTEGVEANNEHSWKMLNVNFESCAFACSTPIREM
jgi:hypothetical protein